MKCLLLILLLPLAACSTQGLYLNEEGMPRAVINNNLLNKKAAERFAFNYDPTTKKMSLKVTSVNMDNAEFANNALMAYSATKYLDAEEAMHASDNAVTTVGLKESTKVKAIEATPTLVGEGVTPVFSPAIR